MSRLLVKLRDLLRHVSLLILAQLRENGERERLFCGAFGLGEIAFAIAEVAETFLEVQRQRIVNFRADFGGGEMGAQFIAARGADDELIVDVVIREPGIRVSLRRRFDDFIQLQPSKFLPVKRRPRPPSLRTRRTTVVPTMRRRRLRALHLRARARAVTARG